jgi:hypothetical protein
MKKQFNLFFLSLLLLTSNIFAYKTFDNPVIIPCELLTKQQVESLIPGTDDGYTASTGGSLMKGVDSYQCSYSNDKFDLLTVIVHVAKTAEDFDWIKPKKNMQDDYEDAVKLSIGDGGWLYGDPNDLKIKVSKGFTVLELNLSSDNAKNKSDAFVKLAEIILKKI